MWQDYTIAAAQVIFVVALVPTILDKAHKPALTTCLLNGGGMAAVALAYLSLNLWWSGGVAVLVGVQWFVLALQRYRLDKKSDDRPNIPLFKLLDIVLMR